MPPENCSEAFVLHDFQIKQHSEALQRFETIPATLIALNEAVARINTTMDRIEERSQTRSACMETHRALEILRAEQLIVIRKNIEEHAGSLDAQDKLIKVNTDEISEIRGVLKFLKWAIPVAVTISPGIAMVVLKVLGK